MIFVVVLAAIVLTVAGAYLSYCRNEATGFIVYMSLVSMALGLVWAILVRQLNNDKGLILAASITWDIGVVAVYGLFPLALGHRLDGWVIAGLILGLASIVCLQIGSVCG